MKQTAETRRVRWRAFTLVELMIAVVIIGFIAGGLYWRASRSADDLQRKVAIVRARSLDQAKLDYLQASGSTAQTNWSAAATDEARYTLIRSSLHDASAEATLAAYAPPGFSYQFDPSSLTLPTKTLQGATYIDSSSTGKVSLMLTVNDVAAGQVLGAGTYDTGTTVTISAAPFSGYQFVNFTRGATILSTSSSLDVVVSSTQTIQANFVAAPASNRILTVNRNITSAGTVSPAGGSYSNGSSVTITATPNTGYVFDSWSGDIGGANPASASLTVTMNQDRVVQANFLRPRVTVVVQPNNSAWGSVSGGGSVPVGTNISISATPMLGYRFDHWQNGATTVSTSAAYTYAVTGAATLTAVFAADTSGAAPGTYGSSAAVPVLTIDSTGRVVNATIAPLGTMAVQQANAVAVTGGAIDGTAIGATTPNTGKFTDATVTGVTQLAALAGVGGPLEVDVNGIVRVGTAGEQTPEGGFVTSNLAVGETATQSFTITANAANLLYDVAEAPVITLPPGKWMVIGNVRVRNMINGGSGESIVSLCDSSGTSFSPSCHVAYLSALGVSVTPIGVITVSGAATTVRFGVRSQSSGSCTLQRGQIVAFKINSAQLATANADDYVLKAGDTMTGPLVGTDHTLSGKLEVGGTVRMSGIGVGVLKADATGNVTAGVSPGDWERMTVVNVSSSTVLVTGLDVTKYDAYRLELSLGYQYAGSGSLTLEASNNGGTNWINYPTNGTGLGGTIVREYHSGRLDQSGTYYSSQVPLGYYFGQNVDGVIELMAGPSRTTGLVHLSSVQTYQYDYHGSFDISSAITTLRFTGSYLQSGTIKVFGRRR